MKVLLLGEYSGVHNCLKIGLTHFGVEADVASDGDAWKGFPTDINFASPFSSTSWSGRVFKNIKPFFYLDKINKYDLVQLINPLILTPRFGVNELFVERVIKDSKRLYLLGAGDDPYYYEAIKSFKYNPLADSKTIDNHGKCTPFEKPSMKVLTDKILEKCTGILPLAYDYWAGYAGHPKIAPVIPMPLDVDLYRYKENTVKSKVVFYHGITRAGFKGSKFIIEAFDRMRAKHSNEAEFIVAGRVPVAQYIDILERTNVLVDQALSYSYGMNALISMAMGKVVMSGAEDVILPIYGEPEHPVINITPDVNQICDRIEWLITHREQIPSMGAKSRSFVERHHSHIVVAERFLNVWKG